VLLDEFIERGAEEFIRLVEQIPSGLQTPDTEAQGTAFLQRLVFVQRYAEFHKLCIAGDLPSAAEHLIEMFNSEVTPRSWWAVLLTDCSELLASGQLIFRADEVCELIGRLEVLSSRVQNGYGSEYLGVLMRIANSDVEQQAYKRLEIVRLSLARYYARCGQIGVGGRGRLVDDWTLSVP